MATVIRSAAMNKAKIKKRKEARKLKAENEALKDADFDSSLVSNVEGMLKGTDKPEDLKNSLLEHTEKQPGFTLRMVRLGWEEEYQLYRDKVMNVGVVGALFLSVVAGFLTPLEPIEDDDMWASHRSALNQAWLIFIIVSTILSVAGTVGSVALLVWSASVVTDADDFLWFSETYHSNFWVIGPVMLSVIIFLLALMCGLPVLAPEPVASIVCFGMPLVLVLGGCRFYIGYKKMRKYRRETGLGFKDQLKAAITSARTKPVKEEASREASRQVENPQEAADVDSLQKDFELTTPREATAPEDKMPDIPMESHPYLTNRRMCQLNPGLSKRLCGPNISKEADAPVTPTGTHTTI